VAYHAGIPFITGGFVGVDVFFVISGFLITSIIVAEVDAGKFSILNFYRRRILRIFPLLLTVLLAVGIVGFLLFLPNEFRELGHSISAAALFVSNFYFWNTSGYFDAPSDLKPLLHTWSLAVEEQFYVFFPLMIMVVGAYFKRRYVLWLSIAVLLSFVANVAGVLIEPSAAFYLLPTRAWEMGVGSLIAVGAVPAVASQRSRNALAIVGVLLIVVSMLTLTRDSTFPGWNALYPVVGSALVIAYAQGTLVGKWLSLRPVVYIGLISYALYLWHWPVIVYAKLIIGSELGPVTIAGVLGVSLVLAALSRPLIERPFRFGLQSAGTPQVVTAGLMAVLVFGFLGWGASVAGQVGREFPRDVLEIAAYSNYREMDDYHYQFRPGECMIGEGAAAQGTFNNEECLRPSDNKPNIVVLGDSHAAHLWRALSLELPQFNFLQASASGCRPVRNPVGEKRCTDIVNHVYQDLLERGELDGMILAGRWRDREVAGLAETARYIAQYTPNVVVMGPVPEYKGLLPILLAQSRYFGNEDIVDDALDTSRHAVDIKLAAAVEAAGAHYISIQSILCGGRRCLTAVPETDIPMQFDYGHFTLAGARQLARSIAGELAVDLSSRK
jgi:peptidoglycan/LPS O-acetylase OafA/YrhL